MDWQYEPNILVYYVEQQISSQFLADKKSLRSYYECENL